MLHIQDPENKPFNTSAILKVIMTSCMAAKFDINDLTTPNASPMETHV